ncbi:GNAT family N-acetyltransferase [Ruegeria halocynthiae]|uniref:GNAT family N-acetyltransferase n=1 Tax=Ruegeria halocynthiae TaxID=985054 RepID=UPI000561AA85|nr:GNAT family N-acetyltransferase [Ruegeria halocynthiae]
MLIRPLDMASDLNRVVEFYVDAPDYWEIAEGSRPGLEKAKEFFKDLPPDCDPKDARRLGLFLGERLSGIADLFFGFPEAGDAYIGLMMLGPWARNQGMGKSFLSQVEGLARAGEAKCLYLAVMTINSKGRAFWEREGFSATGLSGMSVVGDNQQELHRLVKSL